MVIIQSTSLQGYRESNEDSEIILKPRAIFKNPYTDKVVYIDVIVLCDTYKPNGEPTPGNIRFHALQIFDHSFQENVTFQYLNKRKN